MRDKKQFELIKRIAHNKLHISEQALSKANANLIREKNKLAELEQYKLEYESFIYNTKTSINILYYKLNFEFANNLKNIIAMQTKQVEKAEAQLLECKLKWQEHHKKHEAITKYTNKLQELIAQAREYSEQKQLDTLVNDFYAKNNSNKD